MPQTSRARSTEGHSLLPNSQDARDLEQIAATFSWQVPDRYNIGVDVCDKWSHDAGRLALIHKPQAGESVEYTFVEIRRLSNQAANLMLSAGLTGGDRIAVLLPQMPETAIAHVAIYKMGAIAVPLFRCESGENGEVTLIGGDCTGPARGKSMGVLQSLLERKVM